MPAVSSSTLPPWTILQPAPRAWPPLRPQIRLRPQRQPQPTLSKNSPGGVTTTDLPAQSSCVVFVAQYRASQTALSACFRQPSVSNCSNSCLFYTLSTHLQEPCRAY